MSQSVAVPSSAVRRLAVLVIACALAGGSWVLSPDWSVGSQAALNSHGPCSIGVGRDDTLHGSFSPYGPLTWATENRSGRRVGLLWPVGYSARFVPQLEVLDETGHVIAREGDLIIGSCLNDPVEPGLRIGASNIRPPTWHEGDG